MHTHNSTRMHARFCFCVFACEYCLGMIICTHVVFVWSYTYAALHHTFQIINHFVKNCSYLFSSDIISHYVCMQSYMHVCVYLCIDFMIVIKHCCMCFVVVTWRAGLMCCPCAGMHIYCMYVWIHCFMDTNIYVVIWLFACKLVLISVFMRMCACITHACLHVWMFVVFHTCFGGMHSGMHTLMWCIYACAHAFMKLIHALMHDGMAGIRLCVVMYAYKHVLIYVCKCSCV